VRRGLEELRLGGRRLPAQEGTSGCDRSLGRRQRQAVLVRQRDQGGAQLSPNNRWVAYVSNEAGPNEVFVARFARKVSLVGTSSGLNIAAAVHVAGELRPGKVVVIVAVDSGLKCLAGDLFQP
jgi:hypothetical protein